MYSIEIRVQFRAGHRLMPPYKGKCNNPHGEGYTAIFIFERALLDKNGMVLDFGVVKKFIQDWIDINYDHSYMHHTDDEVGHFLCSKGFKTWCMLCNPTAENIAFELFTTMDEIYPTLEKVGVIESFEDSIAWFQRER